MSDDDISKRVSRAFEEADRTGKPQEVLGDDGKRVMLIVCPKVTRPTEEERCIDALKAQLATLHEVVERADHLTDYIADGALFPLHYSGQFRDLVRALNEVLIALDKTEAKP